MAQPIDQSPPGDGVWAPVPAWQIGVNAWILPSPGLPVRVTDVDNPGDGKRIFGWDQPDPPAPLIVHRDERVRAWVPAEDLDHTARIAIAA
jgi:hypothetical protein